jgi:hypothetical protein
MTTIVYDYKAGLVACDSRCTRDDVIISDNRIKWIERDKKIYFFAGAVYEFEDFIDLHEKASSDIDIDFKCDCFVIDGGEVWCYGFDDKRPIKFRIDHSSYIGSGGEWALAGLDFGLSAKQAVKYAITRDSGSGGKIHVFNVKTGKQRC